MVLINNAQNSQTLFNCWHSIPEEKFDFSFDKLRIEVKSSATESRTHHFSSTQLNP